MASYKYPSFRGITSSNQDKDAKICATRAKYMCQFNTPVALNTVKDILQQLILQLLLKLTVHSCIAKNGCEEEISDSTVLSSWSM